MTLLKKSKKSPTINLNHYLKNLKSVSLWMIWKKIGTFVLSVKKNALDVNFLSISQLLFPNFLREKFMRLISKFSSGKNYSKRKFKRILRKQERQLYMIACNFWQNQNNSMSKMLGGVTRAKTFDWLTNN